ncbi:MAG TPA: thiaminase II [Candidatus Micrarchaeia archaeon]|nr:thiaminase II [Candidatus Micrarchaeia archaeon]
MSAPRFSDALRLDVAAVWDACRCHPFVAALGDGTLSPAQLEAWARQDFRFLDGYARALARAGSRAPDLGTATRLVAAAHATLEGEMALHRGLGEAMGIAPDELEATMASPVTAAYTGFLLRVAGVATFAEAASALLPCLWSYAEIGADLARAGLPTQPLLRRVAVTYADPDFADLASWARRLVDRLGDGARARRRDRMRQAFGTALDFECRFWDQAFRAGA